MAQTNKNNQENKEGISYIANAFSTRMMCGDGNVHVRTITEEEFKEVRDKGAYSIIGHQDTANVLGVEMNRESVSLGEGDVLYIAELEGGRLPEGATELPKGFTFTFKKVWVTYPSIKMGRNTHNKDDVEEVHIIHDMNDDSAYFIIIKNNNEKFLEKAYYGDIKRFTKMWGGVPIIEFIDDGCTCTPITEKGGEKMIQFKWRGWNHTLERCGPKSHPWGIFRNGHLIVSIPECSVSAAKAALQSHWGWIHEPYY